MGLLLCSIDLIDPDNYDNVRSVTLVVGTNALNVRNPSSSMSLVADYERVVDELRQLFLKARIGLYNVLPRFYRCEETRERIALFNYIFEHASRRMKNVFWIHESH